MAVRYYLSQILPPDVVILGYRLAIKASLPDGAAYSSIIPSLPSGLPAFTWGIAYVTANDFTAIDADIMNFRLFPTADGKMDQAGIIDTLNTMRWGDLSGSERTRVRSKLTTFGVATGSITTNTSLRAVLQMVGKFLEPAFDETKFVAGE